MAMSVLLLIILFSIIILTMVNTKESFFRKSKSYAERRANIKRHNVTEQTCALDRAHGIPERPGCRRIDRKYSGHHNTEHNRHDVVHHRKWVRHRPVVIVNETHVTNVTNKVEEVKPASSSVFTNSFGCDGK
jgi:hypothetical protein